MKRKLLIILGLLVVAIGLVTFAYLKPKPINKEFASVIYSFEEGFEQKTSITLKGKLHRDPFGGDLILGEITVDKDLKYHIKLRDNRTHFFYPLMETNGANLRTIGTVYVSRDIKDIWLKLDAIDERYRIDGYVFGPASTREEANKLIKEKILRA
ncbi:hypothetical protein [Cohnella sp. AR92]|uniref:hypothetical protein n=1 Tax=Cohnella sp. AR92 TaxID=648716 RepID=UPI000F8D97EB|nr:hypothetical protein [Cohnella sp. AR92]RUS47938.1 hypothetical protein ELR57_05220 [Cohnella sp. AR92]